MPETTNSSQSMLSFIIGLVGIFATFFMNLMGWEPLYMIVGIIVVAIDLYDTAFFAVGIIGMVAISAFTAMSMFPLNIYWTIVIFMSLWCAWKISHALYKRA